jgi:BASS family bile acid:Na+ symporter
MLQVFAISTLVSLMLWSGLQSSFSAIRAVLRDYGFLARAVILSVVVVPLLAVLASRLLAVPDDIETGIILMAVSGGVPFLPLPVRKAQGEHQAAIGLVFVLSSISVITAPITVNLVAPTEVTASLPVARFFLTLVVFQLVPLLIGLFITGAWPAFAGGFKRVAAVICVICIVTLLVLLAVPVGQAFSKLFGSHGLLAILLVVVVSLALGWFAGGTDRGRRVVISMATGIRNPGMALLIANTSFAGTIVVPTVMVYLVIQAVAAGVAASLFKRGATSGTASA